MDTPTASLCLEALGKPKRLEVFRLLVRAGPDGLSFGTIQDEVGLPAATLSHHLGSLVRAGMVEQERQGRETINRASFERARGLVDFLLAECCTLPGNGCAPEDDAGCRAPTEQDSP